MPCYSVRKNGQHIGFICGDLGEHCRECGAVSDNLCDYPVGDGKTCDRAICNEHSRQVGVDLHYCPTHAKLWDKFKRAGGVKQVLENVVPFPD
ncbi:MAG: hypothetical protein ACR2PX_08685 [Endozoicomonas sp.]|uniref:hypothetical protein n=1 Tax=Endozoicomonas sp. TaxID=1892382 RepID=UPI003D9ADCC2